MLVRFCTVYASFAKSTHELVLPVEELGFFRDFKHAQRIVTATGSDASLPCVGINGLDGVLMAEQCFNVALCLQIKHLKNSLTFKQQQ